MIPKCGKILLATVLVLIVVNRFVTGNVRPLPFSSVVSYYDPCKEDGVHCKDTHTLVYCVGIKEAINIHCPDVNPAKPYCNKKSLECSEEESSPDIGSELIACGYNGYFPHPFNCSRYFQCERGYSYPYSCFPRYNYDHESQKCTIDAECYPFTFSSGRLCEGKGGEWVTYPKDRSVFAFCNPSKKTKILVCPGRYYLFDDKLKRCDFKCLSVGKFPDALDDHAFYTCVIEENKLTRYPERCHGDMKFNSKTRKCTSPSGAGP